MRQLTRRRLVDRKIVEYLVAGKSRRWIKKQLGVGGGRFEKVRAAAQAQGYLDGRTLPPYPEALFPDCSDRRAATRSGVDAMLRLHQPWISVPARRVGLATLDACGKSPHSLVCHSLTMAKGGHGKIENGKRM
ncbi:MAG: hypothetical protein M0Z84_07725 [Gammaproteobacteria bacterium]|nr:hypothetical protein [Gammaproteobacteria bacterium]